MYNTQLEGRGWNYKDRSILYIPLTTLKEFSKYIFPLNLVCALYRNVFRTTIRMYVRTGNMDSPGPSKLCQWMVSVYLSVVINGCQWLHRHTSQPTHHHTQHAFLQNRQSVTLTTPHTRTSSHPPTHTYTACTSSKPTHPHMHILTPPPPHTHTHTACTSFPNLTLKAVSSTDMQQGLTHT